MHCGSGDFSQEYGDSMFVVCSSCACTGTHIGCHVDKTGVQLQQEFIESGSDWYCSKVPGCF